MNSYMNAKEPNDVQVAARFRVKVDAWAKSDDMPKLKKFEISVTQKEIDEWGKDAMDNVVQAAIEKKFCHGVEEFSYWPIDGYENDFDDCGVSVLHFLKKEVA